MLPSAYPTPTLVRACWLHNLTRLSPHSIVIPSTLSSCISMLYGLLVSLRFLVSLRETTKSSQNLPHQQVKDIHRDSVAQSLPNLCRCEPSKRQLIPFGQSGITLACQQLINCCPSVGRADPWAQGTAVQQTLHFINTIGQILLRAVDVNQNWRPCRIHATAAISLLNKPPLPWVRRVLKFVRSLNPAVPACQDGG